jgi:hypothetical protein
MHDVQDYSALYSNAVLPGICERWHVTQCGRHSNDRVISLRKFCVHKTSLSQPLFIEVFVSDFGTSFYGTVHIIRKII